MFERDANAVENDGSPVLGRRRSPPPGWCARGTYPKPVIGGPPWLRPEDPGSDGRTRTTGGARRRCGRRASPRRPARWAGRAVPLDSVLALRRTGSGWEGGPVLGPPFCCPAAPSGSPRAALGPSTCSEEPGGATSTARWAVSGDPGCSINVRLGGAGRRAGVARRIGPPGGVHRAPDGDPGGPRLASPG